MPTSAYALGQAQQAAGNPNDALVANGLRGGGAGFAVAVPAHGEAEVGARDFSGGGRNFRSALEIKPDLLEAQRGLTTFDLCQRKVGDAVGSAETCRSNGRTNRSAIVLEREIYAAKNDWPTAVDAYRQG